MSTNLRNVFVLPRDGGLVIPGETLWWRNSSFLVEVARKKIHKPKLPTSQPNVVQLVFGVTLYQREYLDNFLHPLNEYARSNASLLK